MAVERLKNGNILAVNVARRKARFEPKQKVCVDTADDRALDKALARQGASRVGNPIDWITANAVTLVNDDNMNVDFPPLMTGEYEVPF